MCGRLGSRLGEEKPSFLLENVLFPENRRFRRQEVSKSHLGAKKEPKWSQNVPRTEPRRSKSEARKCIEIWIGFRAIKGGRRCTRGAGYGDRTGPHGGTFRELEYHIHRW